MAKTAKEFLDGEKNDPDRDKRMFEEQAGKNVLATEGEPPDVDEPTSTLAGLPSRNVFERADAKEELARLTKLVQELRKRNALLERGGKIRAKKRKEAAMRFSFAEGELDKAAKEVKKLQEELATEIAKTDKMAREKEFLKEKLADTKERIEGLLKLLTEEQTKVNNLKARIKNLEGEVEGLEREVL